MMKQGAKQKGEERLVLVSVFKESIIGGVSMHSTNLRERLLLDDYDLACVDFYPVSNKDAGLFSRIGGVFRILTRLLSLRARGYRTFHFHSSLNALVYYLYAPVLALSGSKLLLSFHSGLGYVDWMEQRPFFRRLNGLLFRATDRIIFMNHRDVADLSDYYPHLRDRFQRISPFIAPPRIAEVSRRPRAATDPFHIMTMGAWVPLYGLEDILEVALRCARQTDVPVHVTFVCATFRVEEDYRDEILARAAAHAEEYSFEVIYNATNPLDYLRASDVFIRASYSDSFGLCVAESLLVGTPTVASNVCQRCENAILFSPGDVDELTRIVLDILRHPPACENRLLPQEDSYTRYLELYRSVNGKN